MRVICKAKTIEKKIAISFDDGPAMGTIALLKILDEYNVKATFFCIGKNIEHDTPTLKQIHEAGHIIGNHSYSHCAQFDFWRTHKVRQDLQQTHDFVNKITGKDLCWFRPPFGVTNPNIAKAASGLGYTTIGWSIRSLDTVAKNKEQLFKRITKQLHPGAIILFHDTCAITIDMLPQFITHVEQQGYEIVPMDKLLNLQAYVD